MNTEKKTKFYSIENEVVKSQAEVTDGNLSCKSFLICSWSSRDVKNTV